MRDSTYTTSTSGERRANTQFFGLDINLPVFAISSGLAIFFSAFVLIFPEKSSFLTNAMDFVVVWFGTLFTLSMSAITLIIFFLIVSPFGKIKLGGKDSVPEFGFVSWVCMLFAAGVGIGMTFYGAAEPLSYYTGIFGTPLNVSPESEEAYRLAFSATIFHWGLNAWSVYAIIGLSLAFFCYNWKLPLTIRSIFYPLLGKRIWGWQGDVIDIIAVLATLFGLTTSLGLGARQATSGLSYLNIAPDNLLTQSLVIIFITSLVIFSVYRGLDKGVKVLSNINIGLAFVLLSFIVLAGPTFKIIMAYGQNLIFYFQDIVRLSDWNRPNDLEWYHDWTIFYWAWFISWSPFVGMFIARISKGRTIREFLTVVMFAPLLFCTIWFTSFGETAIFQFQDGIGNLSEPVGEISLVLFYMLDNLLFPVISSIFSLFMLVLFFVTSADSGSLVINRITSGGKENTPSIQRVIWAIIQGLVAIALLVGGGSVALQAIQSGSISMALPFVFILIAATISLLRGVYIELYDSQKMINQNRK
ncbi:MAG: glycine/betaine ABC transporter [Gammaproteobacteria bacterium]|nr:glycine/betaine ABC transporter [Gammaproteobacteria bacterium]|tara:strand:- start:18537 stop:20123 length:1587 start_codon:yes stop_codon:yes gene_type:complete